MVEKGFGRLIIFFPSVGGSRPFPNSLSYLPMEHVVATMPSVMEVCMKNEKNDPFTTPDLLKDNSALFGGLFLILLGGIFYMSQLEIRPFDQSPWLLFIFIPIFWSVTHAWQQYVENGRQLSGKVLMSLFWGIFPFLFIAGFYFGINSSLIWPLMFIVIGLGMILGNR